MSVDVPKLTKVFNDETRVKILKWLRERKQMSYGDLMDALGETNTGRLNYHLKILGDLVTKEDPGGAYALSRKGVVAIDFVERFQALTIGMTERVVIPPVPYESTNRSLRSLLGLEFAAILAFGIYGYVTSPAQVALQYSLNGIQYSSAPKEIFLALAVLLNIPQGVFLILSNARYRLVNRYPSAISIPGFGANLTRMGYEKRGYWINRLFSGILVTAVIVGFAMIYLMLSIYESAVQATVLPVGSVAATLLVTGVAVIGLLAYTRRYSNLMEEEANP